MKKALSIFLVLLLTLSLPAILTFNATAQVAVDQLTTNPYKDRQPSWNTDGTKILYSAFSDSWNRHIWVMNSDGSGKTQLTFGSIVDEQPVYSPDGSRIAFTRWGFRGDYSDIMMMDVDGSNIQRLTFSSVPGKPEGTYNGVEWSQDGTKLIFMFIEGTTGTPWPVRKFWICTMNPDGTGLAVIGRGIWPKFVFGDSKILFNTELPEFKIAIMNADGTNIKILTSGPADHSPDMAGSSHRIVFTCAPAFGELGDIYVMEADGSRQIPLLADGQSVEACWSPDEKYVAYTSQRSGNYDIWRAYVRLFDPSIDGFSFRNFGFFETTEEEVRNVVFNNPDLSQLTDRQKGIVTEISLCLLDGANWAFETAGIGGHCYGMSAAARYYFMNLEDPEPSTVWEMSFEDAAPKIRDFQLSSYANPYVLGKIFQLYFSPIAPTTNNLAELTQIQDLIDSEGVALVHLQNSFLETREIWKCHSVLAYRVEETSSGWTVWVYDSNSYDAYEHYIPQSIDVNSDGSFSYTSPYTAIEFHQFGAIVSDATVFDYFLTFLHRIFGIIVHSPANVLITDPLSRSIGTDPEVGAFVNEIPSSIYSGPDTEPQHILIFDPIDGTYDIMLMGTANGNYTLTIQNIAAEQGTSQIYMGTIAESEQKYYSAAISETGNMVAVSWECVFKDAKRGTMLKISTDDEYFQFVAPDKTFSVKFDADMFINKNVIIIGYSDTDLWIHATIVDASKGFCEAHVKDLQTGVQYWLIDKPNVRGGIGRNALHV